MLGSVKGEPTSLWRSSPLPPTSCVTREISAQQGHSSDCDSFLPNVFKRGAHLLGCWNMTSKLVDCLCFLCSFSFLDKFSMWLLTSFPPISPLPIFLHLLNQMSDCKAVKFLKRRICNTLSSARAFSFVLSLSLDFVLFFLSRWIRDFSFIRLENTHVPIFLCFAFCFS